MDSGYYLNCMDPGGDTGLALLHVLPQKLALVDHATVPWRPDKVETPVKTLTAWRLDHPGTHRLVYEPFRVRNNRSAAGKDVTALAVIDAVRSLHQTDPYDEVFTQEPVEAKRMATDAVLETLGLHLGHKHKLRHVRDALRHGVTLLTRQRYLPVCAAAFPRRPVRNQTLRPGSHP